MNSMNPAINKEALRQQMLLRALWGDAGPAMLAGWLRGGPNMEHVARGQAPRGEHVARGLAAYRANAGAAAERALAAAYPTLQQLLGGDAFAALARACWLRQPPTAGDLGLWGAVLPDFIARDETMLEEPYLADVARLEWAVHEAERAADALPVQGLYRLGTDDPAALVLRLAPGTAVVASCHPIVTIWQAHRSTAADRAADCAADLVAARPSDRPFDRFAPVRAAFSAGAGECALVARDGWRATVSALSPAEARFTQAVLAGRSLEDALGDALGDRLNLTSTPAPSATGKAFDFEAWLIAALQQQRLAAVEPAGPHKVKAKRNAKIDSHSRSAR